MEAQTNKFTVEKDPKTGKIISYRGRNGETYPVIELAVLVFIDAPGADKPYTIMYYHQGSNVFMGAFMSEEDFMEAQKRFGAATYFALNMEDRSKIN